MPTYKPKQVIRDLKRKGCVQVKSNHGSHQKFRNPKNGNTSIVAVHNGKDLTQENVKDIYRQLGLELDY